VPAAGQGPGRLLFLRGRTLLAQPFDTERLSLTGSEAPVAEDVATRASLVKPSFRSAGFEVAVERWAMLLTPLRLWQGEPPGLCNRCATAFGVVEVLVNRQ